MPPQFPVSLRWPAAPDAIRYRVVATKSPLGELLKLETQEPEVTVEGPARGDGWPEWRVQVSGPDGSWADYLPYMEWPSAPEEGATELVWPDDDTTLHRVVVHDDTAGEVVIKAATLERSYTLDPGRLDSRHVYRWRVQSWEPANGSTPAPTGHADDRDPVPGVESRGPGAIHARCRRGAVPLHVGHRGAPALDGASPTANGGSRSTSSARFEGERERVGIARQMDMLDEHGFKGTFFVDVLAELQFGEGSLQPVFDEVLGRGHDTQLHLHPSPHLRFARTSESAPLVRDAP